MKIIQNSLSLAALIAMTAQAAAASCDIGAAAALKTAAVQQELMVAGLTCGDVSAYNRFVLDYQPALQKSDAELMSYFRDRDGNEAGYDSYKTKLANLAAGRAGADGARYCANVNRDFAAASAEGQTLEHFVSADRLLIAAPEACAVQYDVDTRVAGVPEYDLPATPFGAEAPRVASVAAPAPLPARSYSAPPRAADPDRREAYNDLPRPPRYAPRASDDDYAPPAYAWVPRRRSWYSAYNED